MLWIYAACVPGVSRCQKRASDPQEPELQMIVSHRVGARKRSESSGRAASILDPWTLPLQPPSYTCYLWSDITTFPLLLILGSSSFGKLLQRISPRHTRKKRRFEKLKCEPKLNVPWDPKGNAVKPKGADSHPTLSGPSDGPAFIKCHKGIKSLKQKKYHNIHSNCPTHLYSWVPETNLRT